MSTKIENKIKKYTCIEEATKNQEAFIYIKKSCSYLEAIPFNNLFGVICDIGDTSLIESGIPDELVFPVDMNEEVPRVIYTENDAIGYYASLESDTKEHVLTIIKLFNSLSSQNLTIYTSDKIRKSVESFANENITFCCYDTPGSVIIKANKIITYGYSSRYFIEQKVPTLIIGPYGLGGWVTPDNIKYFLKDNFKGRPNGNYNEFIPLEILVDELMEMNEHNNLKYALDENASAIADYLNGFPQKTIEKSVAYINELYQHFINISKRVSLKSKLVSNINLIKNEDQTTLVQRKVINDTLFSLPESDLGFLEDLKGDLTCKEMQGKYEMTTQEFWNIITSLWERKAIVFSL